MKKNVLVLAGLLLSITISSCGKTADSSTKDVDIATETQVVSTETESEEISVETEETEESETASEENIVIYNIGDVANLGDWEITVTDMKIVDTISADYGYFEPNDAGNKYVQVFVTVTNNGKQADAFMPSYAYGDDVYAKLLYGDGYEFIATNLLGYGAGMFDSSINPLTQKSGEIVFEIPESVASATDELLVNFNSGNDGISFKVR